MKRKVVTKEFDQEQLINFIKDMLCSFSVWEAMCIDYKLVIKTNAQPCQVQKAIYDWLNLPQRKESFELLSKEEIEI